MKPLTILTSSSYMLNNKNTNNVETHTCIILSLVFLGLFQCSVLRSDTIYALFTAGIFESKG